ncbi:MAG: fibronectin type III domain-containing protein, partial [Bacteroidales bacterium]|nr:fibronectin type III domain-containing protein [Bacteroidales bacterium]
DFTSTIQPADGYYNMGVTVNGVDKGIIDHYDFDSLITTQYVTAQFGHKVTASIMNYNNNEYLGSDEVRGTIEPADTMILSGSSCTVTGTVQEHFHLSNFFVNGEDKLADVNVNGLGFTYTIDSLVANTDIVAVVRIDTIAIYYTVNGGNGYVNGNLMEAPAVDTIYVEYGSDFMSQFAAATGYHIVNVTVNGTVYGEIPSWLTEYITAPQNIAATFALNEYDITTAAHGNGSVTPGLHVVYDPQSSYTFTATPAEGYHISQILRNNENLVIADPEAAFTDVIAPVLNDYSYVAYFEPNIYTVTASCGANGTIDPYGAQNYEYGMTPTFTVTANAGYAIEHVYVDGEEVTLTNGTYTFAALTANHTISATFTEDTHTITATAGNGGSIDPDGANVVMTGSTVVYTITPATGYEIADVTVDNVSVGAVATYTFENVTADHTIAATFSAQQFTITATAGANGTITPSGVQTVAYGATPTFTVTADAGYEIDEVRVDGQVVTLTNGAYTFAAVAADHEIFAAFKVKSYTITVTDPNNGTITPNGVITVNHGATPTFTVTPATGYDVTAITVNGSNVIADAQATVMGAYTYTFPAVTANRTLTATMTKKHFTITATAGANGTINGPATVEYGANATYTITPATGYEIANVTVDGMSVGAVATYTFHNVTANHTINATFAEEFCVVPTALHTDNVDSTSATLMWYHPGADSYDIQYRAANANTWTLVQNVPGFSYNLTNLAPNTYYMFQVRANCSTTNTSAWPSAFSFKTLAGPAPGVGVADYVKSHVNVYAEHNRVHIINDYNVDINNVSIYDMYGKLIYSGNAINNPEVIELNVAVGTYVVRLNTQQGPAVYKVHINR